MSHFAVLVVTDETPTDEVLGEVLQPWHEYECTGVEDEYVVDVDVTDELEESWTEESEGIIMPDGALHSRYDTLFYTAESEDEFDRSFGRKAFALPDGAKEVTVKQNEICAAKNQSKIEYAEDYGGWTHKDGKFFRHTNPNAKWDWWQIGGRYSGKLQVLDGAESRKGTRSWGNEDHHITGVDQVCRGDLALASMREQAQHGRHEWASDCCNKAKLTMGELNTACQLSPVAHELWLKLDDPKPRGSEYYDWLINQGNKWAPLVDFGRACWELPDVPEGVSLIEWIEGAPAISTWAVVHDNQWFEHGNMGWWGMSSNDKPDWDQHFDKLWDLIRDDQWVSIVDCHI